MTLWHLLQTTDSLFPTGAFSHSGGIEGLVHEQIVKTAEDAERAIEEILRRSFAVVDLPACALAHRAANEVERLMEIDWTVDSLKVPRELREASRSLGRRRLKVVASLEEYRRRVDADETPGHQAVVVGMHTAIAGVTREEALLAFAYATAAGLVAATMKLLPLGQTRAQALLARIGEGAPEWVRSADAMALEELGGFTPALDIAAMRHEVAAPRLFIS